MTDTENHMVIGNEVSDMDDLRDRIKRKEDRDLVNSGAEHLISGRFISYSYRKLDGKRCVGNATFDDVLQRAYEYTSDPRHPELNDYADCAKEILELYPDSKLAKLIKHMAVVVAADALDIEI